MAIANPTTPAWEITRLFLQPTGKFISRPVGIVYARDQDAAIAQAAETINGIAVLKARRINPVKCPVCGEVIGAHRCKPKRQAPNDGADIKPDQCAV